MIKLEITSGASLQFATYSYRSLGSEMYFALEF